MPLTRTRFLAYPLPKGHLGAFTELGRQTQFVHLYQVLRIFFRYLPNSSLHDQGLWGREL